MLCDTIVSNNNSVVKTHYNLIYNTVLFLLCNNITESHKTSNSVHPVAPVTLWMGPVMNYSPDTSKT